MPVPSWLRIPADVTFAACLLVIAIAQQFALSIPSSLNLGTMRIDGQDFVALAMVTLAIFGQFWKRITGLRRVLVVVIMLFGVIGTAFWIAADGLQSGLNHQRPWIYAFTALIFGIAFGRAHWRTWRLIIVSVALLIALVQVIALFILGWAYGFADSTVAYGAFYGTRPLGADAALIMVLALLVALTATKWPIWLRVFVVVILGLSCIWSQDRSVWLSLVFALLVYMITSVRNRASRWGMMVSAGLLGVLALASVIPVLTGFSILPVNTNAIRSVDAQTTGNGKDYSVPLAPVYGEVKIKSVLDDASGSPALSTGTLDYRLSMWKSRLEADRSITGWILGETLEPNSLSGPDSGVIRPDVTSHSEPVEDLVRGGILGMLCILGLFVTALARRKKSPPDAWIFMWALIPFGLLYSWPAWTWMILGLCVANQLRTRAKTQSLSL